MVLKVDRFVDEVDGKNAKLVQKMDELNEKFNEKTEQQNEKIGAFNDKLNQLAEKLIGLTDRLELVEETSKNGVEIAENSTFEFTNLQNQVRIDFSD